MEHYHSLDGLKEKACRRSSPELEVPILPIGVSNIGRVDPSPNPQTRRSDAVGMSLKCFPRKFSPRAKRNYTAIDCSSIPFNNSHHQNDEPNQKDGSIHRQREMQ
jgi:hypothetical protein